MTCLPYATPARVKSVRGPWPHCDQLVTIWRRISVPIVAPLLRVAATAGEDATAGKIVVCRLASILKARIDLS